MVVVVGGGVTGEQAQNILLNPLVTNVLGHVVDYKSASLMISGTAVDAAFKQGD